MNITLSDTIADRIRNLREMRRVSQADMGRALHVTRASVNSWETGATMPSLSTLIKIAAYFHVTTDYLLGRDATLQLDITDYTMQEQELIQRLLQYMDSIHENGLYSK